jgi:hypothetical protein
MYSKQTVSPVRLDISATVQVPQVPRLRQFVQLVVRVLKERRQTKEYCVRLDIGNRRQEELLALRAQQGTIATSLG